MNVVRITFIGSPLLDIHAKCDEQTLEKFHLKADDCIKAKKEHNELIEEVFQNPSSVRSAGGSALNSARIAKWVLGDKGEITFIGCTGDDVYKDWLTRTLTSEAVIPLYVPLAGMKTGMSICLLTPCGGRSMITEQNAAAALSVDHLNQHHIQNTLRASDYIFAVGYLFGDSTDVIYALADMCSEKQVFSLSLSAEYICKEHKDKIAKVMPRVDILVGNETEVIAFAKAISGQHSITALEALSILSQMKREPASKPRVTVVTRGRNPVMVDSGQEDIRYFDVPDNVRVVDSVGCGDAFAGAFIASFACTNNLEQSVKIGIKAAAEIVQLKGCNPPSYKFSL